MATGDLLGGADTSPLTDAAAIDRRRSEEFYRQMAKLYQDYQQQLAAQGELSRSLDRTIAGTGPSVAGTSLTQGLDQTRAAVNSQASGASGQNAGMASYGAIQALSAAQAKAQQDAAIARAAESAEAVKAKAGILNQQQAATGSLAGVSGAAGTALSGQSTTAAGGLVDANEEEIKQRRALAANILGGVSSAVTKFGAG